MPWTTITATVDQLDDEVATFEGTVTSIDDFSVASRGQQVTALIQYTA
jgi:hypothetical protein